MRSDMLSIHPLGLGDHGGDDFLAVLGVARSVGNPDHSAS